MEPPLQRFSPDPRHHSGGDSSPSEKQSRGPHLALSQQCWQDSKHEAKGPERDKLYSGKSTTSGIEDLRMLRIPIYRGLRPPLRLPMELAKSVGSKQ
ncbi:hypothetical protein FRB95_009988 [Tulasnella sp. JGI-2019a]|nr:hypothetical protein FRB95_009988 [Tulasnella sp. JGI-2019a]